MIQTIEGDRFNQAVFTSDWRYSAAVVGLIRYFEFCKDTEELPDDLYDIRAVYNEAIQGDDEALVFNSDDLREDRYINFVESRFAKDLQPCQIQKILKDGTVSLTTTDREQVIRDYKRNHEEEEPDEETLQSLLDEALTAKKKFLNELLSGNTILKKTFGKTKYNDTNGNEILEIVESNRQELIRETYRYKKNLYANFANTNALLQEAGDTCRLNGYYVDLAKKGKSQGYGFDKNRVDSVDSIVFDFIPFAFHGGRELFFLNNNVSIKSLLETDSVLLRIEKEIAQKELVSGRALTPARILWEYLVEVSDNKRGDLEVISKNQDDGYFKTMYIQEPSLEILRGLGTYKDITRGIRQGEKVRVIDTIPTAIKAVKGDRYINLQRILIKHIIESIVLDATIEKFLNYFFNSESHRGLGRLIDIVLDINVQIMLNRDVDKKNEEVRTMEKTIQQYMKMARGSALEIKKKLHRKDNKLSAYRARLMSALMSHDYDRVCEVLLHLSQYTGVNLYFADALFENFEGNKSVLYTFLRALGPDFSREAGRAEPTVKTVEN